MNNNENYFKDNFTKEGEKVNLEINKLTAECITAKNNKFSLDDEGNLKVNSITTVEPIIIEAVTNLLYPVGSIYMNVTSINPSVLFGGTWEQIQDRFLLACGNTYSNGTMGGTLTHTHTTGDHALTINEMPSHNHTSKGWATVVDGSGSYVTLGGAGVTTPYSTNYTGGSQAHNHGTTSGASTMPPFLAVYIWKRVA